MERLCSAWRSRHGRSHFLGEECSQDDDRPRPYFAAQFLKSFELIVLAWIPVLPEEYNVLEEEKDRNTNYPDGTKRNRANGMRDSVLSDGVRRDNEYYEHHRAKAKYSVTNSAFVHIWKGGFGFSNGGFFGHVVFL